MTALLRAARSDDLAGIARIDADARAGTERQRALVEALGARRLLVATSGDEQVVGYLCWDRSFFARPFITLVFVDEAARGVGIGPRLIRSCLSALGAVDVFTSTNASNAHMQHVLGKLGFLHAGQVDHLDPGDPEWFYVRRAADA